MACVIQPGNLIQFKELAYTLLKNQGGTASVFLLLDQQSVPYGQVRLHQTLKPNQTEKAIFLFLRAEACYDNEKSRIWVLYDEKMWYVTLHVPLTSIGNRYIEKIQ